MKIDRTMSPDEAFAMAVEVEDGKHELPRGCFGHAPDGRFEIDFAPAGGVTLTIVRPGMDVRMTISDELLNMIVCGGALILAERTRRENELRERNAQRRAA